MRELSQNYNSIEIAHILGKTCCGVHKQAGRLGISITPKNTNTFKGRVAEIDGLKLLNGSVHIAGENYHASYDLDWDGKKVNVKSSTLAYNRHAHYKYWCFRVKETAINCDLYLLLGYVNQRKSLVKAWLVPSAFIKCDAFSISETGRGSKFRKFEIGVKEIEDMPDC